jgi:signal transduction histidine kinase
MVELLTTSQPPLDCERMRALDHISKASYHLETVISDILDMSKIEAVKLELRPEVLNVREVIEEAFVLSWSVKKLYANDKEEIGTGICDKSGRQCVVRVCYHLAEDNIFIRADPNRLKQSECRRLHLLC